MCSHVEWKQRLKISYCDILRNILFFSPIYVKLQPPSHHYINTALGVQRILELELWAEAEQFGA